MGAAHYVPFKKISVNWFGQVPPVLCLPRTLLCQLSHDLQPAGVTRLSSCGTPLTPTDLWGLSWGISHGKHRSERMNTISGVLVLV